MRLAFNYVSLPGATVFGAEVIFRKDCRVAKKFLAMTLAVVTLSSCAAQRSVQPQVNSLLVAQKIDKALLIQGTTPNSYGPNNELLYWLDRGMLYHLSGQYQESIHAFEEAKNKWDALYTRSVTKQAMTWAANDYWAAYRGEDFEIVAVNIFQALNFVMLGQLSEALVEARQVDGKLRLINEKYSTKLQNIYKEDAFARLLMGLLYEANQSAEDLNDAFISYELSLAAYEKVFVPHFAALVPQILKESLIAWAPIVAGEKEKEYQKKFPDVNAHSLEKLKTKAQVILIHYNGFVPIKIPQIIPIPLDATHITKLSFPRFHERYFDTKTSTVEVRQKGVTQGMPTESVQDFSQIAIRSLEARKKQIIAKGIVRPLAKYAAEKYAQRELREDYGDGAAVGANILGNVYNLYSEKADLRSWQTLPAQIRITRILVDPGVYSVFVKTFDSQANLLEEKMLGEATLNAGDYKFYIFRSYE